MIFQNSRLLPTLLLGLILGIILPPIIINRYFSIQLQDSLQTRFDNFTEFSMNNLQQSLQYPLWNGVHEWGMETISPYLKDERIVRIEVRDNITKSLFLELQSPLYNTRPTLIKKQPILFQGQHIGDVKVYFSTHVLSRQLAESASQIKAIVIIQTVFGTVILLSIILSKIHRPLQRLTEQSQKLSGGKLEDSFQWKQQDEFGQLGRSLEFARSSLHEQLSQIQESLNFFKTLMDTSPIPIVIYNELYAEIEANHAFKALKGHLFKPEDLHYKIYQQAQHGTTVFETNMTGTNQHKRQFWIHTSDFIQRSSQQFQIVAIVDITEMRQLQDKLIESEKVASLGALVAGVAHEVNTPLGVAVTAVSTVMSRSEKFLRSHEDLDPKQRAVIENLKEGLGITLSNLSRASSLIKNFKEIAVDQISDSRRSIKLCHYLEDLKHSLSPQYKKRRHRLTISCLQEITMETYPGILSQIVTNLVTNSVTHGFTNQNEKEMHLDIQKQNERVVLTYTDNGKGMDEETIRNIYNPFFTTQRAQGNSGLGMHIVYNLVVHKLGGSLDLKSSPGQGVQFSITLPQNSPAQPN